MLESQPEFYYRLSSHIFEAVNVSEPYESYPLLRNMARIKLQIEPEGVVLK